MSETNIGLLVVLENFKSIFNQLTATYPKWKPYPHAIDTYDIQRVKKRTSFVFMGTWKIGGCAVFKVI